MLPPSSSASADHAASLGTRIQALVAADRRGDEQASGKLFNLLYDDLKVIAQRQLQTERSQHTLSSTALVHEAYLRFGFDDAGAIQDRAHFLGIASRVMRQVLVDHARRRNAEKRGGGKAPVTLRTDVLGRQEQTLDILALAEALDRLSARDARLTKVVECRFFGGLNNHETAEALGMSARTVERDWKRARLYLYHLLKPEAAG